MTNLYYLTNQDYTNLKDVSFVSAAPTEKVQEVLKIQGLKTTLKLLIEELNNLGFLTTNNFKSH